MLLLCGLGLFCNGHKLTLVCHSSASAKQFDPALQRWHAMRVSHFEHFKPTGNALRTGLLCVVAPIVLYTWWLKSDRDRRELAFRTGQVSYKDRQFKFI